MNEDVLIDIVQRLTRLEVKMDTLITDKHRKFELGLRTWIALIGSATAIIIAIVR